MTPPPPADSPERIQMFVKGGRESSVSNPTHPCVAGLASHSVRGAVNALGVQAGRYQEHSTAAPLSGKGYAPHAGPSERVANDLFGVDRRPLGVWRAAGLHARRFHRHRVMSLLVLVTATHRVERTHAVATVVVRDALSAGVCAVGWLLTTVGVAATVVTAVERWPIAWALLPAVVAASVIASAATGQRVEAWWRWRGHAAVLVVANVAADRDGCGHGDDLFATLTGGADAVGRAMVLRVDPRNSRAVLLYRRHGFEPIGTDRTSRLRMVRAAAMGTSPSVATAPSWLAPIPVSAPAVAVGTAVGVGLTAVYWGTPAAWLLLLFGLVGGLAADCDLRWLRIPNRLLAAGAVAEVALVVIMGWLFDVPMAGAALTGAAIAGAPLLTQHVATGGRTPGLGDAKLAGVLGLVAGAVHPAAAIAGLLVSLLFGTVCGLVWQRRWQRGPGFPLGPALATGMTLVLASWTLTAGATTW